MHSRRTHYIKAGDHLHTPAALSPAKTHPPLLPVTVG